MQHGKIRCPMGRTSTIICTVSPTEDESFHT
ncbi:hypothetical protein OESDEN_03933 [Oesophagostomum dentatum]|uniref:Uncharacterized protein n=1 Tax=Oesophagostomum dentatum TaxID=61180 RepID=A0A0B1TJX8_OESDE|nr:hypothetical protein OESDEN_03933 [Oesophagostomum dentatum]